MSIDISDVTRRIQYSGSAGTGPYQFAFEILAQTDVAVYVDETLQTLTTDYTVTINGDGTGSVTLLVAATGANTITIIGDRAIARSTDFVTGGDLLADSLNDELDSLTIYCQQLEEKFARCFAAPEYDTASTLSMPDVATRASKYLAFDAQGNPAATSGTTNQFIVSTFAETLLDDTTAAMMRATLDLEPGVDVQAYDPDTPTQIISQVDAEAGTATDPRTWTAQRVAQAIAALANTTLVRTVFTASGNLTFPAGVTQAWVTGQGCGGGGGGSTAGGDGGTVTFGPNGGAVVLTLAGGVKGTAYSGGTPGTGGVGGGSGINLGAAGENGQDKTDIGGGVNPSSYNNALGGRGGSGMFGNLGSGGRGSDGTGLSGAAGGGGGAGEQCFSFPVTVTAAQWDVTIGSGGTAGTASGAGTASAAGQAGFLIVEYLS
jgi:hypothetical protein